ncbi:unnamed protein product, partial [Pocillopora meandrina]
MAARQNVPELGGYDYEFTVKVPDNCDCLVCHLPMKDPVQIVGCGHRLCNICMESLLRRPSPLCPADREPLSRDKIFPDSAHRREILDLTVKCPHFGCSWTGELRAVESIEVRSNRRTSVQKYLKICHFSSIYLRRFMSLEVHIRDECPETEVHCEYRNLGCDAMFPRSNTSSHTRSQVERHLSLALHCLNANRLQVNVLVSLVKEQSQQTERLVAQVKEESQRRERLEAQVREQVQQIERLEAQLKEQSQQTERLEAQAKEQSQQTDRLVAQAIFQKVIQKKPEVIISEPFFMEK